MTAALSKSTGGIPAANTAFAIAQRVIEKS